MKRPSPREGRGHVGLRLRLAAQGQSPIFFARSRGIIIADTKFEWGERNGEFLLIDEVLTPDSSRFWPTDKYAPGRDQESFDKQYVRNYLTTLVQAGQWDKTPPGPELPAEIVANTAAKYREALRRLTE
ncbi:MAG: phosphoribosylaminoimidazolesuccinocarboxamide synthase [Phycisphaerales bacterium]|nr:phosphoribosylaminoimidazolesuccinocarboxamide synthase [Phycisphaerales bacterium]